MGVILDTRYQTEAYEQVKNDFENGNRSCVVFPTGCGKSYIALKMIEDNPDKEILYVSPSSVINVQIREIIEQTYGEDAKRILSRVKFITYNVLSQMDTEGFEKLTPDMVVIDELHRAGAPVWGKRVNELLEKNSNAKVLGLTATPVRTDGRNMAEEICGGISYELPLTEAVARGVLPVPEYICAQYLFEEDIQRVENLVEQVEDEEIKEEYTKKIQEVRRHLEQADGIDKILGRHIQKKNGKYIMFCKDIEDIDTKAEQAGKWFAQVNEQTTISKISSANEEKENTKELQFFRRSSDNALKLALAVNMLNEGYHDEELTGVLMTRPTMSEILFRQQLGRALSRDSRETPQIFDLVNNIRYFEEFRREIKEIIEKGLDGENKEQGERKGYSKDVLEKFKVIEEQIDFIEEFKKLEENLREYTLGGYIKNALAIEKWCIENHGDKEEYERKLPSQTAKDEYEKRLGVKLSTLKYWVKKKYEGKNLDEIEDKVERKIVEIIRRLNKEYGIGEHLKNTLKLEEWCETTFKDKKIYERSLPSTGAENGYEKELGHKLNSIKQKVMKKYSDKDLKEIEDEEDKRIVEIIRRLDKEYGLGKNLKNALRIEEWCRENYGEKKIYDRNLPNSSSKDEQEKGLGIALLNIKSKVMKKYNGKQLDEITNDEDRRIVEIIRRLDKEYGLGKSLKNALEIEEWCETTFKDKKIYERSLPSTGAEDEYEKRLGDNLSILRQGVMKKYSDKDLNEIEVEEDRKTVEIIRRLDKEYGIGDYLKNALRVEEWCIGNYGDKKIYERKLPSSTSKDEYEKILGRKLGNIRSDVIKKYESKELEEIENEEDRRIVEIIRRLDKEYGLGKTLKNALEIEEWCETTFRDKKVYERKTPNSSSKDEYEKRLGNTFIKLRSKIIEEYEGKELEKIEDEEERRIVEIIRRLNTEYGLGEYLKNALRVEEWCIENYGDKKIYEQKLPSSTSKDEYEKILGTALINIRSKIMKKYDGKQLDEITNEEDRRTVEIIRKLDREYGRKRTGQDIGKASFDAPVEECDKAQEVLENLIQSRENSKSSE